MQRTGLSKKILPAVFISFALVCISCETSVDSIPATTVIVPLEVGNQWVYRVRIFNEVGAVIDSSYDTVRVTARILIDNEMWYVDDEGNIQTNRSDGRWIRSGVPYLVEKFPAKLNEFYRLVDTAMVVRVSGVDEIVALPAGRYLSYIYRWMRNGFLVGDFFYVPNLGMIKSEKYIQHGAGVYLIERRDLLEASLQP